MSLDRRSSRGLSVERHPQVPATRGRLRVYLGAAPGVGKTYAMLQDAQRRNAEHVDVVIGWVETHDRSRTAELIDGLEVVAAREIPYKGVTLREMDIDAIISRHPQMVVVDELAHTNVPGSGREKRYEDVEVLLEAGITVTSTLDIQHVESLNGTVARLTGVAVHETVPDWVIDQADEVELIATAPEVLIQRMKLGQIYPAGQAKSALGQFFTLANLTGLQELAQRAVADHVTEYHLRWPAREAKLDPPPATHSRVMVGVDHRQMGERLIQHGRSMAAALKGDLVVVHVSPTEARRQGQKAAQERQLRVNMKLATDVGAKVVHLRGRIPSQLISYAHEQNVTHIVLGHPRPSRWDEIWHDSVTGEILCASFLAWISISSVSANNGWAIPARCRMTEQCASTYATVTGLRKKPMNHARRPSACIVSPSLLGRPEKLRASGPSPPFAGFVRTRNGGGS